jgi:hypothetical protein
MNQIFITFIEGNPRSQEEPGEDPMGRMQQAVDQIERLADVELAVTAQWLMGRLLAARGQNEAAQAVMKKALERAVQIDVKPLIQDIRAELEVS